MEYALFLLWIVYLAPFTLAASRDHPRVLRILALNLALGWTGVGWLAALAWAWREPWRPADRRRPRLVVVAPTPVPVRPSPPRSLRWPAAAAAIATAALVLGGVVPWPRAPWWPEPQDGRAEPRYERIGAAGAQLRSARDARSPGVALPAGCEVVVLEHARGWKRVWTTSACEGRPPGAHEGWIRAVRASSAAPGPDRLPAGPASAPPLP